MNPILINKLMANIAPPMEIIFPALGIIFLIDFVFNIIVFSIGIRVFAKKEIKFPPPALLILMLTISGALMDYLGITISAIMFRGIINIEIFTMIIITILISGLDFLIIKKYLKLDSQKSLKLAIWMGIITNPYWLKLAMLFLGARPMY